MNYATVTLPVAYSSPVASCTCGRAAHRTLAAASRCAGLRAYRHGRRPAAVVIVRIDEDGWSAPLTPMERLLCDQATMRRRAYSRRRRERAAAPQTSGIPLLLALLPAAMAVLAIVAIGLP